MVELVSDWVYLGSGTRPDGIALALPESSCSLTYINLADRVARLAGGLSAIGIHRGDTVATLVRDKLVLLEVLLATGRLGAVMAPFDCTLGEEPVRRMAVEAKPAALIYEDSASRIAHTAAGAAFCRLIACNDDTGNHAPYELLRHSAPVPPVPITSTEPWIVLHQESRNEPLRRNVLSHGDVLNDALMTCLRDSLPVSRRQDQPQPLCEPAILDLTLLSRLLGGPETAR